MLVIISTKDSRNVLLDPELLGPGRILTSDVFYDVRDILENNGIDVTSTTAIFKQRRRHKIQNEYILQICRDLGIKRRHVGIITGDAGYLYFRGERYAVSLDELDTLKSKGTDVVIIEKQGTAEKLRYKSNDVGISLLSTRGFLTENALDLSELAGLNGAKVVTLTDNDISGQCIAANAPYKRIGIDFETLDYFKIRDKVQSLEEIYIPNHNHLENIKNNRLTKFQFLSDEEFNYLQNNRIELHAVLNNVGVDAFFKWILVKLSEISPIRDYTRAINISKPYMFRSDNAWRVNQLYDNRVATIISPLDKKKRKELSVYKGFIDDINDYEGKIKNNFQNKIDNDKSTDISEFDKDLKIFVDKYDNGVYDEYKYDEDSA